jgi:HEAT repeat protein
MRTLPVVVGLGCLLVLTSGPALADTKEDVPSLLKALKSRNPKTRASAAEELGHIGAISAADAKEAIPALLGVLKKDSSSDVRKAAATAIGKMDPDPEKAVPALTQALKDRTPGVRIAAAGALGQLGSDAKDAIPALQEAQKDKDRGVSRAAGMALRAIRGKKK